MKIIIAGGGTGGHLFPGIALAQALSNHKHKVFFLPTQRPFDSRELTQYGFDFKTLPSPRFKLNPMFVVNFIKAVAISLRIIDKIRPDYVVGLGGYGSLPSLISAKVLGVPIGLLEQNVLPGKVTRLFSAWARHIFCQWGASRKYLSNPLRARIVGSPIRTEIKLIDKSEACKKLGLDSGRRIIAILGGSQGAEAINRFITENISSLKSYKDKIAIIHLTGEADYEKVKSVYESESIMNYTAPFSKLMSEIYSSVDLVICRSGGITLAELTALGVPAVLIPYPHAAENHQYLNAAEFAHLGAGIMIEQKDLESDKLKYIADKILFDESNLVKMSKASKGIGYSDSSFEIISILL
jgi:UDP-N-acetylglucosamine--N-acetylmuramyl-(pentapeptide) pyrophosphoryl-undecaprenol N-acetylglucosamine transferase